MALCHLGLGPRGRLSQTVRWIMYWARVGEHGGLFITLSLGHVGPSQGASGALVLRGTRPC